MSKIKVNIVSILLIAIVSISVGIYLLINIDIINVETKQDNKNVEKSDIVYDTQNMLLISDHDTFFTLENIVKQIVSDIKHANYDNFIKSMSEGYVNSNKKKDIIKQLKAFNKIIKDYNITEYSKLLYQVYERDKNEYNCLIEIEGIIHYILLYLDEDNKTYEIRNFVISEVDNNYEENN